MTAKTPTQLKSEVVSSFPDNVTGLITPTIMRTFQDDIIDSFSAGQSISVNQFGATGDGTTDDTTAIQAALTYAATVGHSRVSFAAGLSYKVTSGLTFNISKVGIEGNGAVLDFSSMTSGVALTPSQSEPDANTRIAYNQVNSVDRLFFSGPGANNTGAIAVNLDDAASPNTIAGGSFNHCAFLNWGIDVQYQNGAFCWTFNKCNFNVTLGTPTTYSIVITELTNNGERNLFLDCVWTNRNLVMNNSCVNSCTYFIGCSIDGGIRLFTISSGASVFILGCHIEHNNDTDYWFYVSGTNSALSLIGGDISNQSVANSFSPFYCDSTTTNGGITITNLFYDQVASMTVPFIDGTGRTSVNNLECEFSGSKPAGISDAQNHLAYGGFESANYTAEWTLSTAVRSSAQARTGTFSLSFPASVGVTPSATLTMPASPGQQVIGRLYYKVSGITGTSGTFYVQIDWFDKGGNSLGSSAQATVTSDVSAWTLLPLAFQAPAPKGTVNYNLFIDVFGVGSGTPTAYVDDVVICAV